MNLSALRLLAFSALAASVAPAGEIAPHVAAASNAAGVSAAQSVAAAAAATRTGLQLVSGATAVPLWMLGTGSKAVGQGLWDAAHPGRCPRPPLDNAAGQPPVPPPAAPKPPGPAAADPSPAEAMGLRRFADRVNWALDARSANVALIARAGRPRSQLPAGIRYTHVAFAVFEPVASPQGKVSYTYVVYNLYQGDHGKLDRSYLAQDYTYDFVAGCKEPDVAVLVPSDVLQGRLAALLRSPTYRKLQNPHYDVLANPESHQFDNCATHTLRVVTAAIYQTDDDTRIESDIRAYFHPSPVRLGFFQQIGAGFNADVSFADQNHGRIQTATFDSIRDFLVQNGLSKEVFTVAATGS